MGQMTHQEIFDRVATHLLGQRQKATIPDESTGRRLPRCVYRTVDGRTCAIGCLIPESLYNPDLEGRYPEQLPIEVRRAMGIEAAEPALLRDLQKVHDQWGPLQWPEKLAVVCQRWQREDPRVGLRLMTANEILMQHGGYAR